MISGQNQWRLLWRVVDPDDIAGLVALLDAALDRVDAGLELVRAP